MSLRACPAAAALFALCAASAATAEPFALVPAYDQIYRVDLATRTAELAGETGSYTGQPVVIKGLAFSPNGSLYGASDNTKSLFRLDILSRPAAIVGSLGLAGQGDLARLDALDLSYAVTCDGSAWLAGTKLGGWSLPWNRDKTWAGTLAFVLVGGSLATLAYRGEADADSTWLAAALCGGGAALVAAIVESLPVRLSDNVRVGFTAAITVALTHFLVVPAMA